MVSERVRGDMGYHHVGVAGIDPASDRPNSKRSSADTPGLENGAVNRYEAEPGEEIPLAYHYHDDQEEVFYVLSGTATFDTEDGQLEVGAGEAIRFEPGEYQHGHNETDDPVVALAIGAPGTRHDWDDIRVPLPCPACSHEALGVAFADDRASFELACPECDATMDPPE